jgi:hypothetical protein
MAWKNFVGPLAIAPRRRVVATALMYGLSLTVRFTSAAGEEAEFPAQAAQNVNPMTSIMMNSGAQILHKDWSSVAFHRGWSVGSRGCRTACESPAPLSSISNCAVP